jgi:virginiamycin B lyase
MAAGRLLAVAVLVLLGGAAGEAATTAGEQRVTLREYAVPAGSHPHDVAPARDGGIW